MASVLAVLLIIFILIIVGLSVGTLVMYFYYPDQFDEWLKKITGYDMSKSEVSKVAPKPVVPKAPVPKDGSNAPKGPTTVGTAVGTTVGTQKPKSDTKNSESKDQSNTKVTRLGTQEFIPGATDMVSTIPDPSGREQNTGKNDTEPDP